jgi:hypothetical protein
VIWRAIHSAVGVGCDGLWKRPVSRFAINLHQMVARDVRVIATKPPAAHREPSVASRFRNVPLLDKQQRCATGADKDEFRCR